jgi:hypothetical protein
MVAAAPWISPMINSTGGTNKADQSKKALHANAAQYSNDCYGGGQAEHGHRIACTNGLHDLAPQLGSERASQSDGCPPKDRQNPCAHVRLCSRRTRSSRPCIWRAGRMVIRIFKINRDT